MATVSYDELDASRFAEDLKAAAAPAIKDTELTQAYKFFGVKKGKADGQTDAQLYRRATKDVLSWWKRVKGQGYYNATKGAGKPLRVGSSAPKPAKVPAFTKATANTLRRQYGLNGVAAPAWALKSPQRFETWMNAQLRRKGIVR